MKRANERGVALVIALILMLVLSVIAVSILFVSQSETWSSMNYRLMSQARYGAEAGLSQAANYLLYSYTPPGGTGDPLNNYNMTVSPVTASGNPVILSANSSQSSNYPVASVQTAFSSAAKGTLTAGNTTINYSAYATLLSMRQINQYGGSPATIQTWLITSDGSINGVRNAQVEVSSILERQITPASGFGLFATYNGCGALTFSGGSTVDSYDSSNIQRDSYGNVITQQYGGTVGSNGNLNESGSKTTIYGTMSTPRTGVGNCNNGTPDAWTDSGNATVTGGVIHLPQPITYPPPNPPNPLPPTTNVQLTKNSTCTGITGCSASPQGGLLFAPGSYGNISMSGGGTLHFTAGTYTINSIILSGNSSVVIDSGPVILNVAGQNLNTPIDFSGGSVSNATLNPNNLQVQYAGTGSINLSGGSQSSMAVYAPNASAKFSGGTDWFGSLVCQMMTDSGGTKIHYDRRLSSSFFTVGNYMLDAFTWKKY